MGFPEAAIGELLLAQLLIAVALVVLENQLRGASSLGFGNDKAVSFVIDSFLQRPAQVGIHPHRDPAQA